MALLWIDGFEHLAVQGASPSTSAMTRRYPGANSSSSYLTIQAGRKMGLCLCYNYPSGNDYYMPMTMGSSTTHVVIIGFAIKTIPGYSGTNFLSVQPHQGNTVTLKVNSGTSSEITMTPGSASPITTSGAGISPTIWRYVELKVDMSTTTWRAILRVDGNVLIDTNFSGIYTTYLSRLDWYLSSGAAGATYLDDVYVCDGLGTVNNDFLGDHYVAALLPSNDQSVQWSRVGGGSTNSSTLITVGPDDDTSYVYSSSSGTQDWYPVYQLHAFSGIIAGIQINADARSDSGSSAYYKTLKSGSQTIQSTVTNLTSSGSYSQTQWLVASDPSTGAAWTTDGLGAIYVGLLEQ